MNTYFWPNINFAGLIFFFFAGLNLLFRQK